MNLLQLRLSAEKSQVCYWLASRDLCISRADSKPVVLCSNIETRGSLTRICLPLPGAPACGFPSQAFGSLLLATWNVNNVVESLARPLYAFRRPSTLQGAIIRASTMHEAAQLLYLNSSAGQLAMQPW